MARIFKRPDRAEYYIDYYDTHGRRFRVKGFSSEKLTADLARRLEQLRDCRKAGMPPPSDVSQWLETQTSAALKKWAEMGLLDRDAAWANLPLTAHLDAYLADMEARQLDDRHIRQCRNRAEEIIKEGGFTYWSDVSPERLRAALAARIDRDKGSARTFNSYRATFRAFTNWCIENGRLTGDPARGVKKRNEKADRRRIRRALEADELRRLIAAAQASPKRIDGTTGRDRAVIYLVAASNWRIGEITKMQRRDFYLDENPPMIAPPGSTQKSGRDDAVPIRADVAETLREYFAENPAPPTARAFPIASGQKGADMLKHDLALTGDPADVAKAKKARGETPLEPIPYVDDHGHVADFHSLRHALATMAVRNGADVGVVQGLMRHSDPSLTLGVYTHTKAKKQAEALEALPSLLPAKPAPAAPAPETLPPAESGEVAVIGGIDGDCRVAIDDSADGENTQKPHKNRVFCEAETLLSDCRTAPYSISAPSGHNKGKPLWSAGIAPDSGAGYGAVFAGLYRILSENTGIAALMESSGDSTLNPNENGRLHEAGGRSNMVPRKGIEPLSTAPEAVA